MRLTQLIEFLNADSKKDQPGWPYSHLMVTPSLKKFKADYRRLVKEEKEIQEDSK
jgi:hypothetical protein